VKGKLQFSDGSSPSSFIAGLGFRSRTPFSNKDGSFVIEPVAPGTHRLFITGPDFEAQRLPAVEVKEGEVKDLGVVTIKKGRIVSGKVLTSTGQPVAGATVMAGRFLMGDGARARGGRFGGQRTTSDEDGGFSLRGLGADPLSVVADHTTLGRSATVNVPGGETGAHDLALVIAEPGAVEGTTMDNGKPVPGAIVVARSVTNSMTIFRVRSGADGAFRFDRLAAEEYTVIAFTRSGMRRFPTVADGGLKVLVKPAETVKIELGLTDLSQSPGAAGVQRRRGGGGGAAPAPSR
jgi:hypothetical protein